MRRSMCSRILGNWYNLIRRRRDRKIVLIDFGSVKEIGTMSFDSQGQQSYTQMVGTPVYMPPEQLVDFGVSLPTIYNGSRTDEVQSAP